MDQPLKSKRPGIVWLRTILLYGAAAAIFLFYANFETSTVTYDSDRNLVNIEIFHSGVASWIDLGVLLTATGLLVLTWFSIDRGWLRWPVLGILLGFVLYPYCAISCVFNNLGPWTTHGQVETKDGTQYVFCDSSFLQGQTMAIAEVRGVGPLKTSYRVLVSNRGDSPRSWASLIRPEDPADEYGQLYVCNESFLVGVRHDNRCFLAFDLEKELAFGYGTIETLSPFLCLGDGERPSASDVERTCDRIAEVVNFCVKSGDERSAQAFLDGDTFPGCPPLATVRAGLESDSPAVSSAAQTLLSCYDQALARVRTRLASSETSSGQVAEPGGEPQPE